MIPTYTCINKIRDTHNRIVNYELVCSVQGIEANLFPNRILEEPLKLKERIFNKQIQVDNLTLTSDGRLIDSSNKNNKVMGIENQMESQTAVDKLREAFGMMGIQAYTNLLEHEHTDIIIGVSRIHVVTIFIHKNNLPGIKGNTLKVTNPTASNFLKNKNKIAIGIKVVLKSGNNKNTNEYSLRDYKIYIGEEVEDDVNGTKFFMNTSDTTRKNFEDWLNGYMDKIEANNYATRGSNTNKRNTEYSAYKDISTDMLSLAKLIVDAFGINSTQLSPAYAIGVGLGNIMMSVNKKSKEAEHASMIEQTKQNKNYNPDVYESHKLTIENNKEDLVQAGRGFGINPTTGKVQKK